MTSFVTLEYPTQHPGVTRMASAVEAAQRAKRGFSGTRGLATLLLSAMAAAVMVVAYQVMDTVTEGHLLVGWMALWAVAFVALALFAGTARSLAARVRAGLDSWSHSLAQARADERLWSAAKNDARVMADLRNAALRQEAEAEAVTPVDAVDARREEAIRQVLRTYRRNYL